MQEIVDFIIKTVQIESVKGELAISFKEIRREFNMFMSENTPVLVTQILEEIRKRKEVHQVEVDEYGFYVSLI